MRHQIESLFNMFIVKTFPNKDTVKFLWEHERKQKCLDEVCKQIKTCERKAYSIKFNRKKYVQVIDQSAKMFCNAALKKAKEDNLSRLEKQRRIDDHNRMDEIEAEFDADQQEALDNKIISYPTVESL